MSKGWVNWTRTLNTFLLALVVCTGTAFANAPDPLPSWNSSTAKKAITNFIAGVTMEHGPNYVPIPERIAVFDNDGTLWSEQPMYVQMVFALDRVKALAPQHPEWKEKQPFKAPLEGDMKMLFSSGEEGLIEMMVATHAGMTTDEFAEIVKDWLATAKNLKTKRLYTEMILQPMIELMAYMRANGFKTYIVSGGGVEFMRVFSEQVYGVPPEQVIGSTGKTKFEIRDGKPVIMRMPEIIFIDDKEGKPVGINQYIGRRPIAAFGNSDGDFQMLEWTTAGAGPRLAAYVHHDDADREWAYDRDSAIGRLSRGLDEAEKRGWIVVSMKNDWNQIFEVPKR